MSDKYPSVPEYTEDLGFSTVDEAINVYVATRDALDAERKAYNSYEAKSKAYMDRIEMWLKDKADDIGVESFRTKSGTAFRSVKEQFRIGNWDSYWAWAVENGYSHVVEKRAAKLAVKEIYDSTGELPPGLTHHVEVGMDVRRPNK